MINQANKNLLAGLFLILVAVAPIFSQISEGTELYKKGEYKKAASILEKELKKDGSNADLWNILGLALEKNGNYKDAQKAIEKAVSLDGANSFYHSNLAFVLLRLGKYKEAKNQASRAIELDQTSTNAFYFRSLANTGLGDFKNALEDAGQAISINEKFAAAYLLEADIRTRFFDEDSPANGMQELIENLRQSLFRLEKCVEICDGDISVVRVALDENRTVLEYVLKKNKNQENDDPGSNGAGSNSMKITKKPFPSYTDSARTNNVKGFVRLAVMFRSNGTIGPVVVLEGLPEGLTAQAVKAAKEIKFKPEMRNGKPVTVIKTVVFTFSIY